MSYEQNSQGYDRGCSGSYPLCGSAIGGGYKIRGYDPTTKRSPQGDYDHSEQNKFHMNLDL